MEIVFGIILIILSIALVIFVLLQDSKSHNLSGTITGGAETFFGKNKGKEINQWLPKVTTVVAVAFVIIVVVMYIIQPGSDSNIVYDGSLTSETTADTSADTSTETEADTSADTNAETEAETSAE